MKTKVCTGCKKRKRLDQFTVKNKATGRLQPRCKPCNNAYRKQWRKTSPKALDAHKAWMTEQRRRLYEEVCAYKEKHPCVDCGQRHPHWRMQFDHTSDDKDAAVSYFARNGATKKVWKEIAKCDLVCGHCHMDRTHARREAKRQAGVAQ